jgi:4-amino-4-deoxy-L-arabinose transferase-like glycosyltransferase
MTTAPVESPLPPPLAASPRATPRENANEQVPLAARESRRHLLWLALICLLGVVLRFSFTDRPLLWGDDAYTVYRTHDQYQAMLDILQYDGFTPLHYELYWLLGRATGTVDSPIRPDGTPTRHATGLSPRIVRLLPAFWGSLMVPGMYVLAVHLVRRRTALVVALVTACSAYLLGYSRDGKMYIMQWCFSAWSAATLFWWFRTGRRIAWLAWVATSLAMASSHMTGMALLPFEALFFLTRSNVNWRQSILFVIGLAVIILPPAGYITQFNRWAQESVEDFGFEVEGIGWVSYYNEGRTGPELARYATSAYLFSWEWPKVSASSGGSGRDPSTDHGVPAWILTVLKSATVAFLLLAAVGMMPWSRRLRGAPEGERAPQPWWRVAFWLGAWLLVPGYFTYCRSVPDFASPKDWWQALGGLLAGSNWVDPKTGEISVGFWCALLGLAAIVAALVFVFPRFRRGMVWGVPLVAGVALVVAMLRYGAPSTRPVGLEGWVSAAFRPLLAWADWMSEPVVFTALAVLLPGLVLYYCGHSLRERVLRVAQFALLAGALIGSCWLVYRVVQDKFDKEVAQVLEPASATNGAKAAEVFARHGESAREAARERVSARVWQSIFMPRYIGFVWIAFSMALCALLMRLPTRGLRFAAVTLLVGINLAQFSGRIFAGTEPPLDQVAREIWAHDTEHNRKADASTVVFVDDGAVGGPGHPGYGTLNGQQGKYYLGLARGYWFHPTQWKRVDASDEFTIHFIDGAGGGGGGGRRGGSSGPRGASAGTYGGFASIAAMARRSPEVKRIIVWDKFFNATLPANDEPDALERSLGAGWRRVSVQDHVIRFHWTWAELYVYRRSEYVRKDDAPASLQSAATPAR